MAAVQLTHFSIGFFRIDQVFWAGLQPETKAARSLSAAIYIRSKPHPEHMPRTDVMRSPRSTRGSSATCDFLIVQCQF